MDINKKINTLGWLYAGSTVKTNIYHIDKNIVFDFTVMWGPRESTFTGSGLTLKEARDNAILDAMPYVW